MFVRESPEELTFRAEEVGAQKSCINVDHIAKERCGPPTVKKSTSTHQYVHVMSCWWLHLSCEFYRMVLDLYSARAALSSGVTVAESGVAILDVE